MGLTAVPADYKITLSWDEHDLTDVTGSPTETGISEYQIFRDAALIGTANTNTYEDSGGVVNGESYQYRVTAVDANGNESDLSVPVSVIPILPLASKIGDEVNIILEWYPDTARVRQRFMVYRKKEGESGFTFIGDSTSNSYDDRTVENEARYYYYVVPVDAGGVEEFGSAQILASLKLVKIYMVKNANATSGPSIIENEVKRMLHEAIKAEAGKQAVGEAWESFFPGISADKTIGIKINTLAGAKLSTHPEVVNAVIDGLTQMLGGNFPPYNIIVFDDRAESKFTAAGFALLDQPGAVRVVTTENDWLSTSVDIAGYSQRISRIASQVDYIVNVPVLKDHNEAGITFSLKNFYGIVDNPGHMHGNKCDPMIACVYQQVAAKVCLIVGDCLFGAHVNGPDAIPTFIANALLVGTDPVAVDFQALAMINEERQKRPIPLISMAQDGDARHISTAAAEPYSLGVFDPGVLRVISLEVT
jgi:uncharacterized protein (DUF362 family)